MASSHSSIPTPSPTERALLVNIEESVFAQNPDILPPTETPYEDCAKALFAKDYEKKYTGYIYTGPMGDHGMLFAKYKTVKEANTPFRSTWIEFGDHHWHPILLALELQEDPVLVYATPSISGNSQGITTAPRYYQKAEYINDVDEGTRFLLLERFGPRPFVIGHYPVPQPGRVAYETATREGGFPESLHDDVDIPATRTGTSQNSGGTTTSVGGSLDGQFFPRTNFKSRQPYVKKVSQVQRDGGWYSPLIRVYPPPLPRRIRQNS